MSQNKQTVEKYMDAFAKSDHDTVLSCLAEDIEWIIPGTFRLSGKEAFLHANQNDGFVGSPVIDTARLTEENNVVIFEGTVQSTTLDGSVARMALCDIFEMEDSKVKRLTSFVVPIKE